MRYLVVAATLAAAFVAGANARAQCTDPTGDTFHLAIPRATSASHNISCEPQAVEISLYNPSMFPVDYDVKLDVKGTPTNRCATPNQVKINFPSTLTQTCTGQVVPPFSYEVVSIIIPAFALGDNQVTINFSCPACVNQLPLEADATFTPAGSGGNLCPRTLVQLKSVGCW